MGDSSGEVAAEQNHLGGRERLIGAAGGVQRSAAQTSSWYYFRDPALFRTWSVLGACTEAIF